MKKPSPLPGVEDITGLRTALDHNLDQVYARAVFTSGTHFFLQTGSVTVSLTADTDPAEAVSFGTAFSAPPVIVLVSPDAAVESGASGSSKTGFTLHALSSTTQIVTFTWIALGRAEAY